ncbi:MAG: GNAT family N-acetyltransferase [Gaiellaceae bacterium]
MTRPFSDGDLDTAAAFLAQRHARHREAEPLLPADVDFRAEVEELWRQPGTSGAVSEHGYLIGAPREDPVWGPNVWVELAGHAAEQAEAARDLYALAAQRWVGEGNTRHYVIVPAHDGALLDAWYRLGFGQQHTIFLRMGTHDPSASSREDRGCRPSRGDQVAPPLPNAPRAMRTHPEEDRLAAGNLLVAERDGSLAGCVYLDVREADLHRPRSAFLAWIAIAPEARGTGLGSALTHASLAWARRRGFDVMAIDWRVTNLLASRFWPARGFRATFLRLYRSIP